MLQKTIEDKLAQYHDPYLENDLISARAVKRIAQVMIGASGRGRGLSRQSARIGYCGIESLVKPYRRGQGSRMSLIAILIAMQANRAFQGSPM